MNDSSWFFPQQQGTQNNVTPTSPTVPMQDPLISSTPTSEEGMKTLDDALSEIEQDMSVIPSSSTVSSSPAVSTTIETPVVPTTATNPRLELLKHTLEDVKKNIQKALDLIHEESGTTTPHIHLSSLAHLVPGMSIDTTRHTYHPGMVDTTTHLSEENEHAIEGMFDGQGMVGPDGKQYAIPPNYASKSKLVEGDILKLTISPNGSFIYKQIGPTARRRVIGTLETDPETHTFIVRAEGHTWRVITASVTYFKGVNGDEVVILVPRDKPSKWAAVENIIKKF